LTTVPPIRALPHLFVILAVVAAIIIYVLALDGVLLFDTKTSLSHNPALQFDGTVFDRWRSAAQSFVGGPSGRNIPMASFAANYVLAGEFSVWQLRATNVLLHVMTATVLYAFLRTLLANAVSLEFDPAKARGIAALAALIWLMHPLNVSTVFYVVQRMTQFSAFFVLLGLLVYTVYRGRWARSVPSVGEFVAIALWLLLITAFAVVSKENGALLLWLLPVVEVSFFQGQWGGRKNDALARISWLALLAPVLIVAFMLGSDSMRFLGGYSHREFTLVERVLTEMRVLWHYISWLTIPDVQAMSLHHDDIALSRGLLQPVGTLIALLAWGLAVLAAFVLRKRFPLLLFCVLFFLVGHSLESTVFPLELVWEHRNYLPGMGVCLLLAWLIFELVDRSENVKFPVVSGAVLIILALLLFVRTDRWSDELTLSRENMMNHPQSLRANYHYANTLYRTYKDADEAERDPKMLVASRHYYERMYQIDPQDVSALVSLYFLDQQYFPVLTEQVDWFSMLEKVISNRVLNAADFNALNLLATCLNDGSCAMSDERVLALYAVIVDRYPDNPVTWNIISRYQRDVLQDDEAALAANARAIAANSGALSAYVDQVIIYDRRKDTGGVMLALAEFMKQDSQRKELYRVKTMMNIAE